MSLNIIRKVCNCYTSERREIGAMVGLPVQGVLSDLEYVKNILVAAKAQGNLADVERRADEFISAHD